MARAALTHIALMTAAALALTGCEMGNRPMADKAALTEGAAAKPQKSTRLVDRDVEAPEVFQVTDDALWDGRPSLGGVWVASPDTKDPERVIMRNPANGKFVIGALFRRERENPGPSLQISSDAAAALGILAGAPSKISVTALRREEAPEEAPTGPILDSAETVSGEAAAGAIDAGGVATQPLDAGTATALPAKDGAGEKPGKKSKKDKKSAKVADTEAIATAALDAAAPKPADAAAAPAAPVMTPEAPSAPAATGGRPIQIGIFSVEANAKRAVDKLGAAGVAAEIRQETTKGKTYWSVIARGDGAVLKKVKAAGFADAYMLK